MNGDSEKRGKMDEPVIFEINVNEFDFQILNNLIRTAPFLNYCVTWHKIKHCDYFYFFALIKF